MQSLEPLTVGSSIEHANNMNGKGDMNFLLFSILEHACLSQFKL